MRKRQKHNTNIKSNRIYLLYILLDILRIARYRRMIYVTTILYYILQVLIFSAKNILMIWETSFSYYVKLDIIWGFLQAYHLNIGIGSEIGVIIVGVLLGLYISVYRYIKESSFVCHIHTKGGYIGSFLSIFIAGCMSCLPTVFVSLLGFSVAYTLLGILPFHGLEIILLTCLLIGITLYRLLVLISLSINKSNI